MSEMFIKALSWSKISHFKFKFLYDPDSYVVQNLYRNVLWDLESKKRYLTDPITNLSKDFQCFTSVLPRTNFAILSHKCVWPSKFRKKFLACSIYIKLLLQQKQCWVLSFLNHPQFHPKFLFFPIFFSKAMKVVRMEKTMESWFQVLGGGGDLMLFHRAKFIFLISKQKSS